MSTTIDGRPAVRKSQPTDQEMIEFLKLNAPYGVTNRFQNLDRREAFMRAKQYAHQKKDWNGRNADQLETISAEAVFPAGYNPSGPDDVNLLARDKRPTAPSNKAKSIVRRYSGLLFSEQRKPAVRVAGDADTEAFLGAVREAAGFWTAMKAARNLGGGMGSVAVTVHMRDGEFSYEVHNSKTLTPVWRDPRKRTLSGLLIMWRYQREEQTFDKDNKPAGTRVVDWVYRRIITEQSDTVYRDCKLEDSYETWDPLMSVEHKLGFFPGVWIQNTTEAMDMDGEPDCEGAYQTIDTDDRLIAQCNYGALNNLDPTLVLGYDPKDVAAIGGAGGAIQKGSDNSFHVGKGGDAKYAEMTGAGITVAMSLSDKFEKNISHMTGAVFLDDKDLAGAQSAKAMEYRFEPMLEVADDLRGQYGPAIILLMRCTERMARMFAGATVQIAGADGVAKEGKFRFELPPRTLKADEGGKMVDKLMDHKLGPGGYISLSWPPYFAPTLEDNQKQIANSAASNAAGFVSKETAAQPVAELFGIEDVAGEVAKARAEGDEDAERALAGFQGGVHAERALAEGTPTGDTVMGRPVAS